MGVDRPIDITADQRKTILALLKRHLPNTTAWVYGSRVKWTARPQSDLDLVVFTKPEQERRVSELREAFEDSNLPFRVDLFVWDAVPEQFRKQIEAEHVVLVEREEQDVAGEWRETVYGRFSSDFIEDCLVNLCNSIDGVQTGPFGSQLHKSDYVSSGTPIITVEHLGDNRILHEDVPHVSDHDRERLSKYSLHNGDIVFSRVGSVDRRALVRKAENGWLFSGRCLRVRPDPNKIDSTYLSYFFGLPSFKEHIRAIAVGATMPSLNTQILSDVVVPHPCDLNEQRAIGHVLGTLDDKIALNRRMNETMEAMARALFKSWFIDFDPVRAKMADCDPGLPQHLADLFPDRLVDSEMGKIPEGWVSDKLGSYVEFQNGYAFKSDDWQSNGIPVVKIGSVKPGLVDLTVTSYVSPDAVIGLERFKLNPGDILVGMTGYPGETGLVPIHDPYPYLNQRVGRISAPQDHPENYAWIYAQVRNQSFKKHAEARAHGSAQANVSGKALLEYPVVFPGELLLKRFSGYATPLISRYIANDANSCTLAALRDALVPKLISGEIRTSSVSMGTVQ